MRPIVVGWMAAATAIAGTAAAVTFHVTGSSSSDSKVLGEKIVGTGASSLTSGAQASAKGNSNGNGNGGANAGGNGNSGNAGKTFSISGTVAGLYPGGTVQLQLKISSALNQSMQVRTLSASFVSIVQASNAPAGVCNAAVTVGSWSGTPFTVPANSTNYAAPGSIPVTLSGTAPDACQGATVHLNYTGTGVQA